MSSSTSTSSAATSPSIRSRHSIDLQAARGIWKFRGWNLCERVSRYPKAWIRRRLLDVLRQQVLAAGGVWIRLAPFPHPFRSAFNFRVDLDEPVPEDYHRFALTRNLLADCCTHFVSTHAYADQPEVLSDLMRYDTQSHGHFHYVYRDPESNYRNLERAHRLLREAGFAPSGFAAPHGRWNPGLDDALESLGYEYSSDFQLGYDDFPFFPWKGDRFSRVLQLPVHPVCEGLFLDAGVEDSRVVEHYLSRVVAAKVQGGEPALVYGHPERRLGQDARDPDRAPPPAGKAIAGLADHPDRAGPVVAMAGQPQVHGLAPRGQPLRDPVRGMGSRVPAGGGSLSARLFVPAAAFRRHGPWSRSMSWSMNGASHPGTG